MAQSNIPDFILHVRFYKTEKGTEPVRDWLKSLPAEYKKILAKILKLFSMAGLLVCQSLESWILVYRK